MNDRPTASTINDTQLDQLYELVGRLANAVAEAYELTPGEVLTEAQQAIEEQHATQRTK